MLKLKTTEYWLHASASPSWGRFASADNLLSCFPAARPHSTAPRRFITSHHFFLRLRKNLDDTNLASLNKSHSMIMKTYPQFHRLSLELLSLQYFYYSIVAIPASTLGSWVDWTCRICRTASNWVHVSLSVTGSGWSEGAGSWSVSRQSGDNALGRTPGPGHGHRAIVETMLICIVIHFNIAMDSSSASI